MRILLMADTPENPDSGAAGTEYQTVLALRRLGHTVSTVWADELPRRIAHGNLHYLFELPFAYRRLMLERLRSNRYDVIHINQPHGYLAARAITGDEDSPVFVHRSHGLEPRSREVLRPWLRRFPVQRTFVRRAATQLMEQLLEVNNRAISRYADGHVVSSSLCAHFLNHHYNVPLERIAIIPQAPPYSYQETPVSSIGARRLSRLLHVGQFTFMKAPMMLAAAFEQILKQRPDATLTWVCSAKDHHSAALLLSAGARRSVTFLDWISQDRLIEVYDDHGIFLFPSFFEGFGKAFLEAMARGLVAVCSDEGGAHDLITDGADGFVVPVGDPTAMAAVCVKVMSDLPLAENLSRNARLTAQLYTWNGVAEDLVRFYSRLIEMKKERK